MNQTKVYLTAAKRVATRLDVHSCVAIFSTYDERPGTLAYRTKYRRVFGFRPERWRLDPRDEFTLAIHDAIQELDVPDEQQNMAQRNLRVWLLCMMAACCEDMN